MFIALSQESKSATFLQTDERGMAGIYEKKQKLFTRICDVSLGVCETSIASDMKVMFLLMHFNSNLYFKDLVKTDAHFIFFYFASLLLIIFFFTHQILPICSTREPATNTRSHISPKLQTYLHCGSLLNSFK